MHCTDMAVKLQTGGADTFTSACDAGSPSGWTRPASACMGDRAPPTLALQARHAVVSFSLAQRHMQQ